MTLSIFSCASGPPARPLRAVSIQALAYFLLDCLFGVGLYEFSIRFGYSPVSVVSSVNISHSVGHLFICGWFPLLSRIVIVGRSPVRRFRNHKSQGVTSPAVLSRMFLLLCLLAHRKGTRNDPMCSQSLRPSCRVTQVRVFATGMEPAQLGGFLCVKELTFPGPHFRAATSPRLLSSQPRELGGWTCRTRPHTAVGIA